MAKNNVLLGNKLGISNEVLDVIKKQICDTIYPVGAIYISYNSTSPATLFGGTWTAINGRFLLAQNSTYTAGSTGGEATHKLTVSEMPSHTHNVYIDNNFRAFFNADFSQAWHQSLVNSSKHDTSSGFYNGATGGGQAHNNMPPYLSVYMWRRTA